MNATFIKTIQTVFLLSVFLFFVACSDVEKNAQKITREDIKTNNVLGYEWFDFEYQEYNIDGYYIQNIIDNFAENEHKIIIFTSPSCSCGKEYKKFPAFVKILDSAGINEANYEIFSVGDINYSHPYTNMFQFNSIPSFIVLRNNEFAYSINDTILKYSNSSSYPNTLETGLLEALK